MTDLLRFVEGFPLLEAGVTFMRVVPAPANLCTAAVIDDQGRAQCSSHPCACMVKGACSDRCGVLRLAAQHGARVSIVMQVGDKKPNLDGSARKGPRHRAVYRFTNAEVAASAIRALHGQYLLNNPVTMRIING